MYLIAACLLVYRPLLDKLGISTLITGVTAHGKVGAGGLGGGRRSAKVSEWAAPRSHHERERKDISLNSMGDAQYYGGGRHGGGGGGGDGMGMGMGMGSSGDPRYGSTVVGGSFQRLDGDKRPLRKWDGITATTDIEIAWEVRHAPHAM